MGKRQIRIFQKNLLEKKLAIVNHEVHLILTDNRVFHGVLNEISDVSLYITDFRRNLHVFGLEEIQELVYDLETLR